MITDKIPSLVGYNFKKDGCLWCIPDEEVN